MKIEYEDHNELKRRAKTSSKLRCFGFSLVHQDPRTHIQDFAFNSLSLDAKWRYRCFINAPTLAIVKNVSRIQMLLIFQRHHTLNIGKYPTHPCPGLYKYFPLIVAHGIKTCHQESYMVVGFILYAFLAQVVFSFHA